MTKRIVTVLLVFILTLPFTALILNRGPDGRSVTGPDAPGNEAYGDADEADAKEADDGVYESSGGASGEIYPNAHTADNANSHTDIEAARLIIINEAYGKALSKDKTPIEKFVAELKKANETALDDLYPDASIQTEDPDGSGEDPDTDGEEIENFAPDESALVSEPFKSREEIEAALNNFSISLTFNAEGQERHELIQAVCDAGMYFEIKGEFGGAEYDDLVAGTLYRIDTNSMTYEVANIDEWQIDPAHKIPFALGAHIFIHEYYKGEGLIKTGSDTVAGRNASVCELELAEGGSVTLWIDDEYGFTLKYIISGETGASAETTSFSAGNVTASSLIELVNLTVYARVTNDDRADNSYQGDNNYPGQDGENRSDDNWNDYDDYDGWDYYGDGDYDYDGYDYLEDEWEPDGVYWDSEGNIVRQGGALALAELKRAALNAGFMTDDIIASSSDAEGTTPEPLGGFCITLNGMPAIFINEFETEDAARIYAAFVNNQEWSDEKAVNYLYFCVQFAADYALEHESDLMEALRGVGWGG